MKKKLIKRGISMYQDEWDDWAKYKDHLGLLSVSAFIRYATNKLIVEIKNGKLS